jgi:phosphoribosylanthranilate isomerase
MIKLKICGMREERNILDVAALHPEYMGFIFYPGSPRYVGDDFRMPDLSPSINRVGVFVNAPVSLMLQKANDHQLTYIQMHGDEPVAQCKEIKRNNIGVIKVFSVGDEFDFDQVRPYEEVTDFFLFDTRGKYYGGNAVAFDWNLLERYNQQLPFFLSGGIGPGNAAGIRNLHHMNIHAIDVNSGAEERPALKDLNKIKAITHILNANS